MAAGRRQQPQHRVDRREPADAPAIAVGHHRPPETLGVARDHLVERGEVIHASRGRQRGPDRLGVAEARPDVTEIDPSDDHHRTPRLRDRLAQGGDERFDRPELRRARAPAPWLETRAQDREDGQRPAPGEVVEKQDLELDGVLGPVHRLVGHRIERVPGRHRVQQGPIDLDDAPGGRVAFRREHIGGGRPRVRHPHDHGAGPGGDLADRPVGPAVRGPAPEEIDVRSEEAPRTPAVTSCSTGTFALGGAQEPLKRGGKVGRIGRIRDARVGRRSVRRRPIRLLDVPPALRQPGGLEEMVRVQILDNPVEIPPGQDRPAGQARILSLNIDDLAAPVQQQRNEDHRQRQEHRRFEEAFVVTNVDRPPPLPLARHKVQRSQLRNRH